ncbi:HAD family hydrolase [Angustibacter aerolatus]
MTAALLDVDGTLVDSNYHHVIAWSRAFARHDLHPSLWQIHRAIGMGGDKLVEAVAGDDVEERLGDALRDGWEEEFAPLLGEIQPVEGARDLIAALADRGFQVVLATSGKPDQVDHFLDLLQCRDLLTAWTTSEDVGSTKPDTDLIEESLRRAGQERGIMLGDSRWDFESARRAGVQGVGVLTGGFSEPELRDAGADEVWRRVDDLLERLDESLLAAP